MRRKRPISPLIGSNYPRLAQCARHEILGVLVHEVVDHYRSSAKETCPGCLIEVCTF
ncbi:hypothetical protein DFJ58DRAFT_668688 [Suillus subalutaceus]|uniref:uncharacterized protein n=1 Tax=Suillus subalutaceus TaxID=48586 RepID=UPI001B86D04D|nr:uncharacterized protein DFJ58DRAFT_668688 [Suillus subalutaceus]KAG1837793.1 hypothetical protein DFJ58DRAFT_668688 [Suillus subalutaceus]